MGVRDGSVLVVDAANVVGARADGWWKDRAGAAARLHDQVLLADLGYDEVVLVLEGGAKAGVPAGRGAHVVVVHAPRDGDSAIRREVERAIAAGRRAAVVTADRALAANVAPATVHGPTWLLDRLESPLR